MLGVLIVGLDDRAARAVEAIGASVACAATASAARRHALSRPLAGVIIGATLVDECPLSLARELAGAHGIPVMCEAVPRDVNELRALALCDVHLFDDDAASLVAFAMRCEALGRRSTPLRALETNAGRCAQAWRLTPREAQTLTLAVAGLDSREVAERLEVSLDTLYHYSRNVGRKSRAGMMVDAVRAVWRRTCEAESPREAHGESFGIAAGPDGATLDGAAR